MAPSVEGQRDVIRGQEFIRAKTIYFPQTAVLGVYFHAVKMEGSISLSVFGYDSRLSL